MVEALTCHSCGGANARWISRATAPWPTPSEAVPVRYAGDLVVTISTPDPLVPALCQRREEQLRAIHGRLGNANHV
jgi:hypothetical protein